MAWHAYLTTTITKGDADVNLYAHVVYYDDTDSANSGVDADTPPAVVLHQRDFRWAADEAGAEMRRQVIAEGQMARDAHEKALTLAANFPVGTTVTIP